MTMMHNGMLGLKSMRKWKLKKQLSSKGGTKMKRQPSFKQRPKMYMELVGVMVEVEEESLWQMLWEGEKRFSSEEVMVLHLDDKLMKFLNFL
jgi:hypothetical protein